MLLYPVRLRDETQAEGPVVLGIGLSFPESVAALARVTYKVNGIYYEQEFGPDE